MKKFFLFIIVLFAVNLSYACDCDVDPLTLYQRSSFVAKVLIKKNHVNENSNTDIFKVDIETLQVFKGQNIQHVYVNGYNGVPAKLITSCDFKPAENEEYVIFGSTVNDKTFIGSCSSLRYGIPEAISLLEILKKKANNYTSNAPFSSKHLTYIPHTIFKNYPENFYGKSYIVKLTIDKNKTVTDVEFVSDFNVEIRADIIYDIKNKIDWKKRLADINTNYSYSFLTEVFTFNLP